MDPTKIELRRITTQFSGKRENGGGVTKHGVGLQFVVFRLPRSAR